MLDSRHDEPQFAYALHALPPGRLGRRWRWELWHGASLLAAGWRLSQAHAQRALRTTASRVVHARMGLHPLYPERATTHGPFVAGAPVRVNCGAVTCVLLPREPYAPATAAAA